MKRTSKAGGSGSFPEPASGTAKPESPAITIEGIAQDIASAVVERRLPPGTWLKEEALAKHYTVGRTKIRAAMLMLSSMRLVDLVPDKGAFVSKPSAQEAREVFGVRRLLESEAVRLLVANARPRDYQALKQQIGFGRKSLRANAATATVKERVLGDFHIALAEVAGNHTLCSLVTDLVARSSLITMLYHSSNDAQCSADEHAELLRLCQAGDPVAATKCMVEHLTRIESSLELDKSGLRRLDLVKALLA